MGREADNPRWNVWRNKRHSFRSAVRIAAKLLDPTGPRFKVNVIDMSRTGFRMETGNDIADNARVYLTIPGFHSFQARVVWKDGCQYGCEFTQALHPSVFEHIARRYPSIAGS